jgi:hypothetical protein
MRRERGEDVVFRAWLLADANNPCDSNAVAIVLNDGKQAGHLAADWRRNKYYEPELFVVVCAFLRGSQPNSNVAVARV